MPCWKIASALALNSEAGSDQGKEGRGREEQLARKRARSKVRNVLERLAICTQLPIQSVILYGPAWMSQAYNRYQQSARS